MLRKSKLCEFHYRIFVYHKLERYVIFVRKAIKKNNGAINFQKVSCKGFLNYPELKLWLDMNDIDKSSFKITHYKSLVRQTTRFILEATKDKK